MGRPWDSGWRCAHPERISAIISQNGNAYEEGLSDGWNPIQTYWREPNEANRAALRAFLSPDATRWQYTHGVRDATLIAPESYTLDSALLARPGNDEIQLDLFGDYQSNVALYAKFQDYIRTRKPPLLAVWGKNDPFFLPAGASRFQTRQSFGRSTPAGRRALRLGNPGGEDRDDHPGFPRSHTRRVTGHASKKIFIRA